MIADADPQDDPVRVDHYRNGTYDMLLTLSGGRSVGILRQGPALPTSRLRYRLRSIERLDSSDSPFVTLVLTHADQATRRAIRSLGDPSEHLRTFVATEGEFLAGGPHGSRLAAVRERPGRVPAGPGAGRGWPARAGRHWPPGDGRQSRCGREGEAVTTALPKGDFVLTAELAAITGVGVASGFTVFDNASTWLLIPVLTIALGVSPIGAGWLSPQLKHALFFPIGVLVSLSIASAIYGPLSSDSEPIGFVSALTIIYGAVASVAFCLGWIVEQYIRRLRGYRMPISHLAMASQKYGHPDTSRRHRYQRMSVTEKGEIMARGASSGLPKRKVLGELGVPKSTYHRWLRRRNHQGREDYAVGGKTPWNRLTSREVHHLLSVAREMPS